MLDSAERVFVKLGAPSPLGTVLFSGCVSRIGIRHGDGVWGVAAGASLMGYACRMAGPVSELPHRLADAMELVFTAAGDVDYRALFEDRERTRSLIAHTAEIAEDPDALYALADCARDAWEAFSIAATHQLRKNFVRHGIPTEALPSGETFETLLRLGYVLRVVDEVAGERPANKAWTTPDTRVVGSDDNRDEQLPDGSTLDVPSWLAAAAAVCVQDFEPVAEGLLEIGTLGALDLASFDALPDDDTDVAMVANARFGYALRNSECQLVDGALRELRDDPLIAELDLRVSPREVSQLLCDVIRYGYCGGAGRLVQAMPGTTPEARTAAFDAWTDDSPSDDPYTGKYATLALVQYGYLLHRVFEVRSDRIRGGRSPLRHDGNGRGGG